MSPWLNRHRPVRKDEAIKAPPPTLGEFSDGWLNSISNTVSAGALATYERHVRCWIKPKLGNFLLCDLEQQPELIERAQAAWLSESRRDLLSDGASNGLADTRRGVDASELLRLAELRASADDA